MSKATCEAEYIAMSDACQEITCLNKAIRDMIGKTLNPVTIWTDNSSVKDCTQTNGSHKFLDYTWKKLTLKSKS